jgi:hypothetical protein
MRVDHCSHKGPKQVQMIKADKDYELLSFVGKTMYLHLLKMLVGIQSTIQSSPKKQCLKPSPKPLDTTDEC